MVFEQDEKKPTPHDIYPGQELGAFSVEELQKMIAEYRAEILRIEADIVNKQSTKSAADSVFQS